MLYNEVCTRVVHKIIFINADSNTFN